MSRVQCATKLPWLGSHTSYSAWLPPQQAPSYECPTTTRVPIQLSAKPSAGTGEEATLDNPAWVTVAAFRVAPVTQATDRPSAETAGRAGPSVPPIDRRRAGNCTEVPSGRSSTPGVSQSP